jgi:hypothetical protein
METNKKKEIRKQMLDSSIPDEMKFMLLLASACQNVVEHVFTRIKGVYTANGYECKSNDMISGLNGYCDAVKKASFQFFERVNPHIINSTWNVGINETGEGNIIAHQGFENKVNEIIRLLMKYINSADGKEAYEKVFTLLARLPKNGPFEDKVISHFKVNM